MRLGAGRWEAGSWINRGVSQKNRPPPLRPACEPLRTIGYGLDAPTCLLLLNISWSVTGCQEVLYLVFLSPIFNIIWGFTAYKSTFRSGTEISLRRNRSSVSSVLRVPIPASHVSSGRSRSSFGYIEGSLAIREPFFGRPGIHLTQPDSRAYKFGFRSSWAA